jgi:hypothetical protein
VTLAPSTPSSSTSKNCSPNFPSHSMRCSRKVREGIVPGFSGTAELTDPTRIRLRPTFEHPSTIYKAVQESRNHWTRQRGGSRVSRTLRQRHWTGFTTVQCTVHEYAGAMAYSLRAIAFSIQSLFCDCWQPGGGSSNQA